MGGSRLALVLPGGAALGAYEAGVVDYIHRDVARALGAPVGFDVLCGTSVGALGCALLAAFADDPAQGAARLVAHWRSLRIERTLRLDAVRRFASWLGQCAVRGPGFPSGLLATRHLAADIRQAVPFGRIGENLRRGRLAAVSVSTTHVASGNTTVFVQQRGPLEVRSGPGGALLRSVELGISHLMASAAIPLLFPAVRIGGDLYCEGGLRQNLPLAPALSLGAERIVVASPHHLADPDRSLARARERAASGPLFLLGRMLNALLLDRVDADIERLQQINTVVDAGTRAFGARFAGALDRQNTGGVAFRHVDSAVVRASESIGLLAGNFVRSRRFGGHGVLGRLIRQIADAEGTAEADLVAYLLFDGGFAEELIDLGRQDARKQHERLCALLVPRTRQSLHRA